MSIFIVNIFEKVNQGKIIWGSFKPLYFKKTKIQIKKYIVNNANKLLA